jgi:SAM-dependent methyltransferase
MHFVKERLKKTFARMGFEVKRIFNHNSNNYPQDLIERFISNGKLPWTEGYSEYKENQILNVITNEDLLSNFREMENLPIMYGYGLDERIIEYPWFFSQLKTNPHIDRWLDAGPVMNHKFIIDRVIRISEEIHFSTLSHEDNCFNEFDVSYIYSDLINLPIKDNYYDLISCISTLEHVGCDNSSYCANDGKITNYKKNYDFLKAAKELLRVLAPRGKLLLTIPYGKYMHLGMIQQFDEEMLDLLMDAFRGYETECTFFKYEENGWQFSSMNECGDSIFVEWLTQSLMRGSFPNPHPVEKDMAAATRGLACIRVNK